jgi:uncharacterized protein YjbI with pentapeptide repeats
MQGADLRGSSFKYARLTRTDLRDANLSPLMFENPDGSKRTQRINLSGADLRYADLRGADLRDAILMGADLMNADFTGADLRRADLTGALYDHKAVLKARTEETVMDG